MRTTKEYIYKCINTLWNNIALEFLTRLSLGRPDKHKNRPGTVKDEGLCRLNSKAAPCAFATFVRNVFIYETWKSEQEEVYILLWMKGFAIESQSIFMARRGVQWRYSFWSAYDNLENRLNVKNKLRGDFHTIVIFVMYPLNGNMRPDLIFLNLIHYFK